jgi:hypothetical protein
MDIKLWVFQASAVSAGDGRYQRGRRHPLLMFSANTNLGQAEAEVLARVAESGWTDVNVSRAGEVIPENIGDDGYLRSAADNAFENGCAFVVYDTPLDN